MSPKSSSRNSAKGSALLSNTELNSMGSGKIGLAWLRKVESSNPSVGRIEVDWGAAGETGPAAAAVEVNSGAGLDDVEAGIAGRATAAGPAGGRRMPPGCGCGRLKVNGAWGRKTGAEGRFRGRRVGTMSRKF